MLKAVFSLIVIILFLIFASQNMERAAVHFVTGRPMHLPLILIIGIAFVLGYASAILSFIISASKKRGRQQRHGSMESYHPRR
ncbi:MAG: DUF1049 domain-containing protein [Gammaproteobacteria bacterium]|nr:DUF1049 domain-containing protein [Gammaproteobacteria bacterium]